MISYIYKIKLLQFFPPVNLSYINLVVRPSKNWEGKKGKDSPLQNKNGQKKSNKDKIVKDPKERQAKICLEHWKLKSLKKTN